MILCLQGCKAQNSINKLPFRPTSADIAFEARYVIKNEKSFQKSIDTLLIKLKKAIKAKYIKEKEAYGEEVNQQELEFMINGSNQMFKGLLLDNAKTHNISSYRFQDSTIIEVLKNMYGEIISNKNKMINRFQETFSFVSSNDLSPLKNQKNIPYAFRTDEILGLKEFRNETKEIQGFKCFKVVLITSEISKEFEDFGEAFLGAKTTYTLYVTDKIKSKYHPKFKNKTLLKKYYPLEIVKKDNSINGIEERITLTSISLK